MRGYDLSIVIVNWNVREELRNCLASIYRGLRGELPSEVFVVDNASRDGSVEMVREEFPLAKLVENRMNLGFTAANNQAIRRSQGRYVLLLNPDTEVVGDALARMVDYMDTHPEVGLIGPQLLASDGSVQSSRRRFPSLATAFLESTVLQRWFTSSRVIRHYYVLDRSDEELQAVDWVAGACLLVRREAIEDVGLMDEDFFMYSEELDWCYRIKRAGWQIIYFPEAKIIHHEGRSSQQEVPARHIYFQESKITFFRKHHGLWQARALRAFLLLTYLFQLCEEALKWLVGHKRPLRRQRIATYCQVLGSGLRSKG